MDLIEIVRVEENSKTGTIGVIKVNKKVLGFCLELPDKDNERNVSRIPSGLYRCAKYYSNHLGYRCIKVLHVWDRSGIAIHPGNSVDDVKGCIVVGSSVGKLTSKERRLVNSGNTFKQLMESLGDRIIYLDIKEMF